MSLLKFVVSRDVTFDESSLLDPLWSYLETRTTSRWSYRWSIPRNGIETQIDESKDADLEKFASNEPHKIAKVRDKR